MNLGIKGKIDKTSLANEVQFSFAISTPIFVKSLIATPISAIQASLIE